MARTITIDPGAELTDFIATLVESGRYKTTSEVIRAGLRLLQEDLAASKLEQLRQLIEEGERSGIAKEWNVDEFLSRMKATDGEQDVQARTGS
ncbi:type II toxin-antitoxin system ParD family antitoxin [Marinobacter sp. OP 3.4]|uniref:type II toxin-antitoxin system ParD family antitoxin n=1 Tax=Marinobacter sp. OP 3.4 TaxID=3076501 RepID=UPI002E21EF88